MLVAFFFVVLTDELKENGGQQHENESLDETDEQFHEIEGNRWQPCSIPFACDGGHGFQCGFTREDVAE